MSKEISMESLYANGMGIELPISNNTKQTQESYPCSNIIDNTNITNSLEYLEYHSLIEKNNTKDMIKLNKKLNDHYGKYNKSLENYLINNANTSKENYNNYINTNKELYNELMMSREDSQYSGATWGLVIGGRLGKFIGNQIDKKKWEKEGPELKKELEIMDKTIGKPLLSGYHKIISSTSEIIKSVASEEIGNISFNSSLFRLEGGNDKQFYIALYDAIGMRWKKGQPFKSVIIPKIATLNIVMKDKVKKNNSKYAKAIVEKLNAALKSGGAKAQFIIRKENTFLTRKIVLDLQIEFGKDYYQVFDKLRKFIETGRRTSNTFGEKMLKGPGVGSRVSKDLQRGKK